MKKEFSIQMSVGILYDYMLYHMYTSFQGILGTAVGVLLISAFFMKMGVIYLIAGVVITAYLPWTLFLKANQQMVHTKVFAKPLHYTLSDEGITVEQDGEAQTQSWEHMVKAVSTGRSIIVYTSKVNATIFPKSQLGEERADVIQIISAHMPPNKVKIKC